MRFDPKQAQFKHLEQATGTCTNDDHFSGDRNGCASVIRHDVISLLAIRQPAYHASLHGKCPQDATAHSRVVRSLNADQPLTDMATTAASPLSLRPDAF